MSNRYVPEPPGFRQRFFRDLDLPERWSRIRQQSCLTFPFALLTAFAIWLIFFIILYDVYVASFGTRSYLDYVLSARFVDVVGAILGLIGRRETVGVLVLALALASPSMFGVLVFWMLRFGRAYSRRVLYLLHIRSVRRLAGLVVVGEFLATAAVVVYFAVFYVVATGFEQRGERAAFFSGRPLAMVTSPFGSLDLSGTVDRAPIEIRRAGVFAFIAALSAIALPIILAIEKQRRMIYGAARFGTLTDAADLGLRKKRGIVLGSKQGSLLVDDSDKHVLVIGSPGQGKSRSLVIPSMMRFGGSMFILDFGGELYKDMAGWLGANCYGVHVIAPGKLETDGFNPFDFISHDPDDRITGLQKLSFMIMPERTRSDASDFWEESARRLLTALMGFVIECPDTRNTLGELQRILGSMPDERLAVMQLTEKYQCALSDATRMQLNKFSGRHEKLGEGIAAEIGAKLDVLQNRNLEALLSATTIPLKEIRNRKMAVFLDVDIQTSRIYERFISMLIETTMDILIREGPLRDGQHDVMVMLDEFGNAGRLETILTQAPLMRKYGIRFVTILQDSAQLERIYERTGREIMSGSSTIKVYMNFQNPRDAQHVSIIAGKTTEWLPTSSYSYRHGRRYRQSSMMPVQKDLLSVSELMMLKPEELILHVAGAPIFKILKIEGSDDPRFGSYTKLRQPPRPKLKIVETDDVSKRPTLGESGSVVYLSTLDGLRARLGLDSPGKDDVDISSDGRVDSARRGDAQEPSGAAASAGNIDLGGPRPRAPKDHERASQRLADIDEGSQRPAVLSREELIEGFGIGDHDHWRLPDGLFDGRIQPDNVDPSAINEGIMALIQATRPLVRPATPEVFEKLQAVISDPLQEEGSETPT